jgi:hypothetical protein
MILYLCRRENSKKYKFQEFQKLLVIEQAKVYKDNGESCIKESGVSSAVYNDLRNQAINLYNKRAYIPLYLRIINDGRNPLDYSALGLNYIMTKQYGKAIKF